MSTKRIYWLMLGLNILMAAAILGSIVVGDSLLKKQSNVIINQKLENAVLEKEQIALQQARQDLDKYAELQQIAKQVVPQEKDQALTTREIISLADKAGIKIGSVGFPSSTLGNMVAKPSEGSVQVPTTTAISQAKPVTGITGLLELQITVVSDTARPSGYGQIIAFLANLENNRRTAQVSQISIQPDAKDNSLLNFTLTLTVYIKP